MTITWNPSDKSTATTLSGGNLVAVTTNSNNWSNVRCTNSYFSGQLYLELSLSGSSSNILIGVANSSQSMVSGQYVGSTTSTGLAYEPNNNFVYPSGTSPGQGLAGAKICVAYDFSQYLIWFRINGGNWNGNASFSPTTGIGGNSFKSVTPGPYFPALSSFNTTDSSTVNFGDTAFSFTVPTNFYSFSAGMPINTEVSNSIIPNMIRKNSLNYTDPSYDGEDWLRHNLTFRRKPLTTEFLKTNLSVRKSTTHTVLLPPDNSVNVAKLLYHTVLNPADTGLTIRKALQHVVLNTDNGLSIRKALQHVVLEAPPLPKRNDVYTKYARFFQNKPTKTSTQKKTPPLGKRLYVFNIT